MRDYAVVVVGGGPTGMMLAAELRLAGVDVAIVERRPTAELAGSRAGGFHARTIELLDQRGIADRFLADGQIAQTASFGGAALDIGDFPTRHPYGLGLWQNHIERILAGWAAELDVRVHRGEEVVGLTQNGDGVELHVETGESTRAQFVVGADGGRSVVRRASGIAFAGPDATRSHLIAEAEITTEPPPGIRRDELGIHGISRVDYEIRDGDIIFAEAGPVRIMVTEERVGPATEPTLDDLRAALVRVYDTDFGVHDPIWLSRFTDATRQAAVYRDRRVLLAGDAAHIHHPSSGQGIGLGIQDAVNLGWKLGQVVRGQSSDALLDTYHSERHPADARALRHTMAQSVLQWPGERVAALSAAVGDLMGIDEARRRTAALIHGLDVRYDLGDGHLLLGRRMPDLDIKLASGSTRVYALLHRARPVLINLTGIDLGAAAAAGRVQLVEARYDGAWELPVLGAVPAPGAVLVRPDGHVAWAGDSAAGLPEALTTWFG